MRLQIKLIRHGKTPGNEQGRYIGARTDESLSEVGRDVIRDNRKRLLGDSFGAEKNVIVFSSPMKRCLETTLYLGLSNPVIIDELKEIDFGEFENKNYEELNGRDDYQAWIDSGGKNNYPGGEPLKSFIERSKAGFENIVAKICESECDKAIVVCHGGNIMAILSQLTGEEYFDFQIKNGEGYLLELEVENGHILGVSYNRI